MFQFPSNGKGDSKFAHRPQQAGTERAVSIPFKRESGFKAERSREKQSGAGFNSLQTGKRIQRHWPMLGRRSAMPCFNSLQTGKGIQSRYRERNSRVVVFSFNSLQTGKGIQSLMVFETEHGHVWEFQIPFKRERGFKAFPNPTEITKDRNSFNSLQTGKGIQRGSGSYIIDQTNVFNSLQTGKGIQRRTTKPPDFKVSARFQFPSNGKGDSKSHPHWRDYVVYHNNVSIPFKRERGFKELQEAVSGLRAKKPFQFPSNGHKGIQRQALQDISKHKYPVSIPFKRERGFKEDRARVYRWLNLVFQFPSNGERGFKVYQRKSRAESLSLRFNSLQTGKGIQRSLRITGICLTRVSIPFKRERGFKVNALIEILILTLICFNSLQTGKGIQSSTSTQNGRQKRCASFNSLQTGKGIQRASSAAQVHIA